MKIYLLVELLEHPATLQDESFTIKDVDWLLKEYALLRSQYLHPPSPVF